jgi:hypothetical protein
MSSRTLLGVLFPFSLLEPRKEQGKLERRESLFCFVVINAASVIYFHSVVRHTEIACCITCRCAFQPTNHGIKLLLSEFSYSKMTIFLSKQPMHSTGLLLTRCDVSRWLCNRD